MGLTRTRAIKAVWRIPATNTQKRPTNTQKRPTNTQKRPVIGADADARDQGGRTVQDLFDDEEARFVLKGAYSDCLCFFSPPFLMKVEERRWTCVMTKRREKCLKGPTPTRNSLGSSDGASQVFFGLFLLSSWSFLRNSLWSSDGASQHFFKSALLNSNALATHQQHVKRAVFCPLNVLLMCC